MPEYVYKESPTSDFYIGWSTVVEAPTWCGDRAYALSRLRADADPWLREDAPHHPDQRLKRADETGTSCVRQGWGGWGSTPEIYEQRGTVKRADLFVLARRLLEDETADVTDLITPFEREVIERG